MEDITSSLKYLTLIELSIFFVLLNWQVTQTAKKTKAHDCSSFITFEKCMSQTRGKRQLKGSSFTPQQTSTCYDVKPKPVSMMLNDCLFRSWALEGFFQGNPTFVKFYFTNSATKRIIFFYWIVNSKISNFKIQVGPRSQSPPIRRPWFRLQSRYPQLLFCTLDAGDTRNNKKSTFIFRKTFQFVTFA